MRQFKQPIGPNPYLLDDRWLGHVVWDYYQGMSLGRTANMTTTYLIERESI